MRVHRFRLVLTLVLGPAVISCDRSRETETPSPNCDCATALRVNGWCEECRVGYFATLRIESRLLFDVLDAHGHTIDPASIDCESCKRALASDGFCAACEMGYVKGQAYLSRIAHALARGEAVDVSRIRCETCRENARRGGWCDSCDIGRVGNFLLADRKDTEEAGEAYRRLRASIEALDRCETCAVASFTGGLCPVCKISYAEREGKPPTGP